jgi:hypothetical protein
VGESLQYYGSTVVSGDGGPRSLSSTGKICSFTIACAPVRVAPFRRNGIGFFNRHGAYYVN